MQITYVGGSAAGEASQLAVQAFANEEILTAMRNGSGNLELIGWSYKDGKVARAATATAGTAENVALARMGRRAVTAVRSGSGRLLLISWDAAFGLQSINRLHDSGDMAGEASHIAIVPVQDSMLITAMRDGSGDLMLICWRLNPDGSFARLSDSHGQAGTAYLVAACGVGNDRVVTAVRNGDGDLELISWRISGDGKTIYRETPAGAIAGFAGEIAITPFSALSGEPGVVTAIQNSLGNLELTAWGAFGTSGFRRLGDTNTLPSGERPGTASHISIGLSGYGTDNFLAAMRRGSGDLELIDFTLDRNGGWRREADWGQREGTDVNETALATFSGHAVTAIRERDFLKVAVWQVSNSQPVFPYAVRSVAADPA